MTNKKATKRALLTSVLAIVMCLVMLIGSTFAWFTDTASTAVNTIQSGNLDVELEYSKDFTSWTKVTDTTKVFEDSTLWEPGRTEVVYLKVKNAGTLALKYTLGLGNISEGKGKNVEGNFYFLSDYVKMGVVEATAAYENRAAAINAVTAVADTIKTIGEKGVAGETLNAKTPGKTYAMVIYMPTDVGNEANPKNADPYWAAKLSFGVKVTATQATVESDSFGNTYDEKASTDLSKFSTGSGTYEITNNIQADGRTGAVETTKTAQVTINADVYAVYAKGDDGIGAAIAVWAHGSSKVVINGGDFRQVGAPADDDCDLIYASDSAQIEINSGTFQAADPTRTLNCKDGSTAKITVNGGRFYKYNPETDNPGEVVLGEGHTVTQNGDWFVVS